MPENIMTFVYAILSQMWPNTTWPKRSLIKQMTYMYAVEFEGLPTTRAVLKIANANVPLSVDSPTALLYEGMYNETGKYAKACARVVILC